jgi:hypothetical protein
MDLTNPDGVFNYPLWEPWAFRMCSQIPHGMGLKQL